MRALPAERICPKPVESRAMFGRTEVRSVERVEHHKAELDGALIPRSGILRQREVEIRVSRTTHDADAGVAERLRLRVENAANCVGIEPAIDRALRRVGSSGSPMRFGRARRSPPMLSTLEPAKRGGQRQPALQDVNARELASHPTPDPWSGSSRCRSAVHGRTAAPTRSSQRSGVRCRIGRLVLGAQVEAVLWLTEGASVDPRAAAAGRDVIGRVGDRLPQHTGASGSRTRMQVRKRAGTRLKCNVGTGDIQPCDKRLVHVQPKRTPFLEPIGRRRVIRLGGPSPPRPV